MVRLAGGQSTMSEGFQMANRRLPQIAGWALISATVGLILQVMRSNSRDNFLSQLVLSMIGGVWAYMTFFVVPILIVEGVGPIEAIKRSKNYFGRTWGEQLVSGFGFGIFRMAAMIPGVIVGVAIGAISPIAGIIVAIPLVVLGMAIVNALEGIFKMALYMQVVEDDTPQFFEQDLLRQAYAPAPEAYRGM